MLVPVRHAQPGDARERSDDVVGRVERQPTGAIDDGLDRARPAVEPRDRRRLEEMRAR